MANSITIPATGSGTATPAVAAENVSSVYYQQVKLIDATPGSSGTIGVGTNPLKVIPGIPTTAQLSSALISITTSMSAGDNYIVAGATSGATIRIHRMLLLSGGSFNATLYDGSSSGTALTGLLPLVAQSGITLDFSGEPWFICSSSQGFNIFTSTAVAFGGTVWYVKS